ncbi:hypothetical protein [Pedobacter alluvionis]|uniref:DUF4231 domain-containing protein n=1 Tax=Pedobacter alluvionis TaxID=475253 RepID=A0A497XZC4_9SPHI|nr:hypothetical protein [Pedobacter alluvionis]RLJ72865.1 hypothetical protein BCL90_4514 [Pedobacter alluvionis]TFB29302.1 hypothetical protein E3V97_19845 [Pedobacter alluvionis]
MDQKSENFNDLVKYLEKETKQHQSACRVKNVLAQLLFLITIIFSALGLVNTGTNWFNLKEMSAIAAMPGIILIFSNTFKFEARSKWNKLKQRKLEGLLSKLKFENATVAEISKEMREELEKLDEMRVQLEKPIAK